MPVPGAILDPTAVVDANVEIAAADGRAVPLFVAEPRDATALPTIVVIPHGMGLDDHIRDVTRRFAAQGFVAAAPDVFARIGGPPPAGADLETLMRVIDTMSDAGAMADLTAAARWLRGHAHSNGHVACIGFCMGGRLSLLLATQDGAVDRAIDCWGGRITRRTQPPDERHPEVVVDRVDRLAIPLLGVFGAEDPNPDAADVAELRSALERHGKEHRIVVYEDAGHALFADTRASYREAQAHRAWKEFLDFLEPMRT